MFLLVLIGTASISSDAPAAKQAQPEEPLAQLGIAPGGGEANNARDSQAADMQDQAVPIAPPPAPTMNN